MQEIERLIAKWRERVDDAIPTDRAIGIEQCADELTALLSALGKAEPPDPPHVREDYRDVWLSGWRAGRAQQLVMDEG